MGKHSHVKGKHFTARMVEVFDSLLDSPETKLHALRGLQLAGGPFPFAQGDSTDAGRNWSQTPHRLDYCFAKWERRAQNTAKSWVRHKRTDRENYNAIDQLSFF